MSLLSDEESDDAVRRIVSRLEERCDVGSIFVSVHFSVEEESAHVEFLPVKGRKRSFHASSSNNFRTFRLKEGEQR